MSIVLLTAICPPAAQFTCFLTHQLHYMQYPPRYAVYSVDCYQRLGQITGNCLLAACGCVYRLLCQFWCVWL